MDPGHVAKLVRLYSRSGFFTCVSGSGSDLNLNSIWIEIQQDSTVDLGVSSACFVDDSRQEGKAAKVGVVAEFSTSGSGARRHATAEVAKSLVVQALGC